MLDKEFENKGIYGYSESKEKKRMSKNHFSDFRKFMQGITFCEAI